MLGHLLIDNQSAGGQVQMSFLIIGQFNWIPPRHQTQWPIASVTSFTSSHPRYHRVDCPGGRQLLLVNGWELEGWQQESPSLSMLCYYHHCPPHHRILMTHPRSTFLLFISNTIHFPSLVLLSDVTLSGVGGLTRIKEQFFLQTYNLIFAQFPWPSSE